MTAWDIRTDSPQVSVCVLAYNHGPFIAECLDSLLRQRTTFPYEICIGEDDSSDETRAICQRYAEEFPQTIRLFLRSREDVIHIGGRPTGRYNFMKTLEACRGQYIAMCDGDDYWMSPKKLQLQVDALEANPDSSLCFCNVQVAYEDGSEGHPGYGLQKEYNGTGGAGIFKTPSFKSVITDLARGNYIYMPGVVFRNWLLDEALPDFLLSTGFGDWPLHLCTAQRGSLLYLNEVLAVYQVHAGGIWSLTSNISRLIITIDTACLLLNSSRFSTEVNQQLSVGIHSHLKVLWKLVLSVPQDENLYHPWFCSMDLGESVFVKKIERKFLRRYRYRSLYRFYARCKSKVCG